MRKNSEKTNNYSKIENAIFVHRLKHGLAAIKWSLKMILSGDFGQVSDEQKGILEKSVAENEELILLANNLLNGIDIKEDKDFLNKDLCDAEQLVDDVIESYETKITEKKIELEFLKPEHKIEAFLDKEKIKIAIQNILDNAIRYTKNNGKIIISLEQNKNVLELKIQDSGIGIPENQKDKLFIKFFRGDNAVQASHDGSGLGLFIAKNIFEAHGGKIWFDSTEGQGSTFYIELPLKK